MLPRSQFEPRLKLLLYERKGEAFQDFFSDLMERAHPGDFQRVRPWGVLGDRKCDGYLVSQETVFQVYAPDEATLAKTRAKIREDFAGAKEHWPEMRGWTFVHNAMNGLAADVLKDLQDLAAKNPGIAIQRWGYPELRERAFAIDDAGLVELIGTPLTPIDVVRVGIADLRPVLEHISTLEEPSIEDVRTVPAEKLQKNNIDDSTRAYIALGMQRASLVERYFRDSLDPMLGDRVASEFHKRYESLRAQGVSPDMVFYELQVLAGGTTKALPRQEAATLAVLAYLFEQCDIFERPDET